MIEIPVFILTFVFVISLFFGYPYYMSHLQPRFVNDAHRQLDRDRKQARKKHKKTKHITDKIKVLVRAELERK